MPAGCRARSPSRPGGGVRRHTYAVWVRLAVGDRVVYAAHGVGQVIAHEVRVVDGASREVVVVALSEGLTVSLPLELAESQLRSLATEAELRRVRDTLRQDATATDKPWLARRRDMQEKLSNGGSLGLAEIVRDTAQRGDPQPSRAERSAGGGERDVCRRARLLLSTEIAAVRGVDVIEADRWIELQLSGA